MHRDVKCGSKGNDPSDLQTNSRALSYLKHTLCAERQPDADETVSCSFPYLLLQLECLVFVATLARIIGF